ncbi:MAG: peptidoglycan-binding protein [Solirubrobacterales bacterium]
MSRSKRPGGAIGDHRGRPLRRRRPPTTLTAAVLAGILAMSGAVASGAAGRASGGTGLPGLGIPFGSRVLRVGMEGSDVAVLNGIVKSKLYGSAVPMGSRFGEGTASAVRRFQQRKGLHRTGVVTRATADALAGSMKRAGATWYGPGLYGNHTACGQVLHRDTIGVAHRTLPCGTPVTFAYHGHYAIAVVIDRGPYSKGNDWDLTNGLRELLGFEGRDEVRYAVARRVARRSR